MPKIDYNDFAELYLGRSPLGQSMPRYRRFDTAAKALRFAVEELPRDVLRGSTLEVDEERFNSHQIDELYNASQYPLKDLNTGIPGWIAYQSRDDEGTQAPIETLNRGWGSCRDMAVLFVEAARCLGFGARIVSGYLWTAEQPTAVSNSANSTHAWAEVFVPGAGWITFDPTNRSTGGLNLIPVAMVRQIDQAAPVSGHFSGRSEAFQSLSVAVELTTA